MRDLRRVNGVGRGNGDTKEVVYHLVGKKVLESFGLSWENIQNPLEMAKVGNLKIFQNQFGINKLIGKNEKYGEVHFFPKGKLEEVEETVRKLKKDKKEIIGIMQGKHKGFSNMIIVK